MSDVYLGRLMIVTAACQQLFRNAPTIATPVRFPPFVALREVWHRLEGLTDDMRAQSNGHANADGDGAMLVSQTASARVPQP